MNTKTSIALLSTTGLAAGIAQSQVVSSGPLNLTQTYSGSLYRQQVDMTADGTPDFTFGFEGSAQKPYFDARTGAPGNGAPNAQSGIVSILAYANTGLPVTPAGTTIDAAYATTYPAQPGGSSSGGRGYMYLDGGGSTVVGDWSNTSITEGYVGIMLNGTSYGWLHFIDDPSAQSLTLVDWAYQSTPGVGLQTGPVPEPSTLALGGIGAAALMVYLRRRKQMI